MIGQQRSLLDFSLDLYSLTHSQTVASTDRCYYSHACSVFFFSSSEARMERSLYTSICSYIRSCFRCSILSREVSLVGPSTYSMVDLLVSMGFQFSFDLFISFLSIASFK